MSNLYAFQPLKVPAPIVLLTDFGLQDSYVGVMKGVIASICPTVPCLDLTHGIPPQQVVAASLCLSQAHAYFPDGSIFLCVVDPGVGSQRRAIAVECDRSFYVGPDNGLGSGLWRDQGIKQCVQLTNSPYWRTPNPSETFHGRDIFAPVAAHIANGVDLAQLGNPLDAADLVQLPAAPLSVTADAITGVIVHSDHFGNLISNIPASLLTPACHVYYQDRRLPWGQCYADQAPGQPLALIGSHGFLEIAVNGGNAQAFFHSQIGDRLVIRR